MALIHVDGESWDWRSGLFGSMGFWFFWAYVRLKHIREDYIERIPLLGSVGRALWHIEYAFYWAARDCNDLQREWDDFWSDIRYVKDRIGGFLSDSWWRVTLAGWLGLDPYYSQSWHKQKGKDNYT